MKKTQIFLVGNAHLDPIWQWHWQEGSAEAKATIRSALDRMKEFPEFKFVCSSASVFQWIKEFVPEMFEEVRQRVQEGRFVIVGGWFVQPDCNSPSAEGFARQSLYSQRYFKEKFGVTATVGYDVDSFGHNAMLPQILKKSGMDSYLFMRPAPHEKELDSDVFHWVAPDGSSVLTYRILDPYCFNMQTPEELEQRLQYLETASKAEIPQLPFFYGVGNHGGGPTIQNLQLLENFRNKHPELEVRYSTLQDFFDAVQASEANIPEHRDDLQHHASGCYAAVSHLKNGIRRSECNLVAAETYSTMASLLCGRKADNAKFEEAWKRICFLHFHDSMGGCSIKEAHEDARYFYGMAQDTAAVVENNALQSISWQIDTKDRSKGLPFVVFNPNGFDVKEVVCVNAQCDGVTDSHGTAVPIQLVHSTAQECYWRKDTAFEASVPALGYAVYYLQNPLRWLTEETFSAEPCYCETSPVFAKDCSGFRTANHQRGVLLENEYFRFTFEPHTGYLLSVLDKVSEKELLADRGAVPLVIDEYYHDTWSHGKNFFTDVMARFSDAELTVTESGPVRATVKVVSHYNSSSLTQYFSLTSGSRKLEVHAEVDWHEKHKMLKMAWPMKAENPSAFYEIPFGVIERPADGEEEPGQRWTAVKGAEGGYAIVNNNTYSSSVKGNVLLHTILRSPIYGDHGGPRDAESEFTDQGEFRFSYVWMPVQDSWSPVIEAAFQLNKPVSCIMESWHEGKLEDKPLQGLSIDQSNIMLSALKRSEDNTGLVLRLYETEGKKTSVTVTGKLLPKPLKANFTPYSVNTYFLADDAAEWKEVLLTEFDN